MQSLLNSFRFAFGGLRYALATQRNLRIHLTAAALALWMGQRWGLSPAEWAVLWLCIGLVLAAELVNTALEAAVDLLSPGQHPLAAAAKDTAAAAVLVCALAALGVGLGLFWRPAVFREILALPRQLVIPAAILTVGVWAVFGLPYAPKRTTKQKEQE